MEQINRYISDAYFFPLWMANFEGQLKRLHNELVVTDDEELGIPVECDFKEMDFIDFCVLVYNTRPDLIDYQQN